jgi:type IV pilus assembly protein PilF
MSGAFHRSRWRGALLCALLCQSLAGIVLAAQTPVSVPDGAKASEANLNLGISYFRAGNLQLAKDKLERARDQDPRNAIVHGALGLLYARLGDDARADTEFNNALRIAPNDPDVTNNYAVYLCGHGKVDAGVKRFEQAAANPLYKTPWVAWTNAAFCLRSANRATEASALYERALRAQPSFAEAAYQYADLELAQQKPAAAYQRVEAYLSANPTATPDLLLVGWRAARAQGDQLSALKLARRLQTDFPNSAQTLVVTGNVASGTTNIGAGGNGSR